MTAAIRDLLTDEEAAAGARALLAAADEWDEATVAAHTSRHSITAEQRDTYWHVFGEHGMAHARPVSDWLREIAGDLIGGAA